MPETPSTPAPSTAPATPAPAKPVAPAPAKKVASTAPPVKKTTAAPATPAPAKPAVKPKVEAAPKKPEAAAKPKGPAPKVIDASGLVLGRACSVIAKRVLNGENIVVINAEQAVVIGRRETVLEFYTTWRARGSVRKGPHYPRRPDRIFRRTVRGMLPFNHSRGREAFKRIMTYIGTPDEFAKLPRETIEAAHARPSVREPLTLAEVSKLLGVQ